MTPRTSVVASVRGLRVSFTGRGAPVAAVRGVDLDVESGACLAIVGESGSGKSVTARALLGLAGPTATVQAERLELRGADLTHASSRRWQAIRGQHVGLVLQDALTSLDSLRRVGDEVREPLDVHALLSRADRQRKVQSLLASTGITDPAVRARQYPHELSGGLRQRALIASAIAADPELIIADEPTTALDATVQAQILELLEARTRAGDALLLISHDLAVVASIADRIAVMHGGVIVEEGPTAAVLGRPEHPYTVELLAAIPTLARRGSRLSTRQSSHRPPPSAGCRYQHRCPLATDRCQNEEPDLVDGSGADRRIRCWHPGSAIAPVRLLQASPSPATATTVPATSGGRREPVLEFRTVSKGYPTPDGGIRCAVDNVTFTIHADEALGLVGESGAGKSTVAALALAIAEPAAGSVLLHGETWSGRSERERRPLRRRIQLIPQDPLGSFDPRFTVERVIGEAFGSGARAVRTHRARIRRLLEQVELDGSAATRNLRELSGGQRQRVAIARALAGDPELLICDEPVSALDVCVQAQILDLFADLRQARPIAMLVISHDLGVIHHSCDRVLVMKDGRIVESGPVDRVLTAPEHAYTRRLVAALPAPITAMAPPDPRLTPERSTTR